MAAKKKAAKKTARKGVAGKPAKAAAKTVRASSRRAASRRAPGKPARTAKAPRKKTVQAIPDGYYTVTPYLILSDASGAIDFYKRAFGASELLRMGNPDGRVGHAELRIGNSVIMMADEFQERGHRSPRTLGGTSASILLYVPDVDAVFERALRAGAKELQPLTNQFYGDRSGFLEDPFGHHWTIATHVEDVSPEEMERRMAAMAQQPGG